MKIKFAIFSVLSLVLVQFAITGCKCSPSIVDKVAGEVKAAMGPVRFENEKQFRTTEAIMRLKDIRDIQIAYKSVNGKFTSNLDSLILFYNTGKLDVIIREESKINAYKRIQINVKDTLFNNRKNFVIDSIKYIPFSGKQKVEMESVIRTVSGVQVPLFEARMPYKALLKGMDNQLIINLINEKKSMNRYEGLKVGDVCTPNNNAGNWE